MLNRCKKCSNLKNLTPLFTSMERWAKRLFVGFWKDGLLAELQAKMSRGCRFLLFWHCRARPCKWPQPYDPDFDLSLSDLSVYATKQGPSFTKIGSIFSECQSSLHYFWIQSHGHGNCDASLLSTICMLLWQDIYKRNKLLSFFSLFVQLHWLYPIPQHK